MRSGNAGEQEQPVIVARSGAALRCHCGSLLARLVPEGVEIKCRRCKRRVIIPLNKRGEEQS
jgi:phage FluMu protein Com